MGKVKIGTNNIGYPERRNFTDLPFSNFEFKKVYGVNKILDQLTFKWFGKSKKEYHNFHRVPDLSNVKLYHFFNAISNTKKPWFVTHEYVLPRYNANIEKGLSYLAQDSCKQIIAFCENAYNAQQFFLQDYPYIEKSITPKMTILHPGQQLYDASIIQRIIDAPLEFTFVGVDFFRKGGVELIKACKRLKDEGFQFKLNLVTKFHRSGWKDFHITDGDVLDAKKSVGLLEDVIDHYGYLSSYDVKALFSRSHLCILPTYAETYGYVVLEAQACGCPVISTNIPPLNEINDNSMGWLLDVPLTEREGVKTSDTYSQNGLRQFSARLEESLYSCLKGVLGAPELIDVKRQAAVNNLRKKNNIADKVRFLEDLYEQALM